MVKDTNSKFISTAEIIKSHKLRWSEDIHHDIILERLTFWVFSPEKQRPMLFIKSSTLMTSYEGDHAKTYFRKEAHS